MARAHTHTHSFSLCLSVCLYYFFGRGIGPSQTPVPDDTHHSYEIEILAPSGIRTRNPSKRAAAVLQFRPFGHWDRPGSWCSREMKRTESKYCTSSCNNGLGKITETVSFRKGYGQALGHPLVTKIGARHRRFEGTCLSNLLSGRVG